MFKKPGKFYIFNKINIQTEILHLYVKKKKKRKVVLSSLLLLLL